MKIKVDFRRYFLAIRKKRLILILVAIVSLLIGIALTFNIKDNQYMAKASVCVTVINESNIKGENILLDYTDIVTSRRVANRASKLLEKYSLSGKEIKKMVTCSYSEETPIYYIQVTSSNPELSMNVADAVQKAFVIEMKGLIGDEKVQILDPAYEYEKVFDGRINQIIKIILITLLGICICLVVIVINCFITRKSETISDVTLNGEIEVLGVIPNFDVE